MAMKMCIAVLFIVCFLQLWFHCVHSAWSVIYLVKLLNTVIFVYRGNAFFFFKKQCKSLPTQNILFWNGVIHSVCYIIPHDMALPLHSLCLCSLHSIIISPGSLHVGSHSYDSILHGYLKSCKFKLDSNQRTVFSFKTTIWKVANPDWGWNKKILCLCLTFHSTQQHQGHLPSLLSRARLTIFCVCLPLSVANVNPTHPSSKARRHWIK